MNIPKSGSYGYEQKDAQSFASWTVDYFKYDNCNIVNNSDMKTDYQNMQTALANCGRPIVYSVCTPFGYASWMPLTGHLWRIGGDIVDKWDNGTNFYKGIINCIDANASLASYASPGAWNDPEMLEIGNGGCTAEEYRTQMSMWCIMAAPLIAGNDIRTMLQATKDILLNKEVIAVDQDSAGIQGSRISSSNGIEIWCKPLGSASGTTKAVALLNRNGAAANITVNFSSIGVSGNVTVRDLWAKADKGSFTGSYTMNVPSHETGMLKLSKTVAIEQKATNTFFTNKFRTEISNGKIVVVPQSNFLKFSVSVFTTNGQLLARKEGVACAVAIPVKSRSVYIVDVNCQGYINRSIVSVF